MLQDGVSHRCVCVNLSSKGGGGVLHHFGELQTSGARAREVLRVLPPFISVEGWFPKGWFWRTFLGAQNRNQGTNKRNDGTKNPHEGTKENGMTVPKTRMRVHSPENRPFTKPPFAIFSGLGRVIHGPIPVSGETFDELL